MDDLSQQMFSQKQARTTSYEISIKFEKSSTANVFLVGICARKQDGQNNKFSKESEDKTDISDNDLQLYQGAHVFSFEQKTIVLTNTILLPNNSYKTQSPL